MMDNDNGKCPNCKQQTLVINGECWLSDNKDLKKYRQLKTCKNDWCSYLSVSLWVEDMKGNQLAYSCSASSKIVEQRTFQYGDRELHKAQNWEVYGEYN